jgi:hypothetical protein
MTAAEATARRLLADTSFKKEDDFVDAQFELLLNTAPTSDERADVLAFVRQIQDRVAPDGGKDSELQAWSQACQALFASSRFQILD